MIPTITLSTGVVFTFNDGDVIGNDIDINTNLDFDSMPGMTPDMALLYDYNGVVKQISVSGQLTLASSTRVSSGTSVTTIDEQRQFLEKNLNGAQSGATYRSTYTSTWNGSAWIASKILIARVVFNEKSGLPNELPFTLTLYVGDV